jgi:histidinol dehydrogenase
VEIDKASAAALAPSVDRIARAEGFPVHAESAMIRR